MRVTAVFVEQPDWLSQLLVVAARGARSSWMPMLTATLSSAALSCGLGNPTSAGMHAGMLAFAASTPGTYHYLCPVPRHARKGMTGTFIDSGTA